MVSALLLYSIKSAVVLAMLYLPYMLMLRRESFFRFNRMMLLGILVLSLVLPLCNVPWMSLDRQPVVQAAQLQMLELGIPIHVLPEVQVLAEAQESSPFTFPLFNFSLFHLFTFIYIVGMVALLLTRLWQIGRLQFGLKRGALWHHDEQGIRIYCHSGDVAPFSWMQNIVINEKDYDEAGREIVLHEMGHIQARHSWDVVLLTLVQMLQWWNPLVYVLGISLRDVHEYEADDFVLRQGVSAQGYQLLLIRKAVGSGAYAFANSFNHSLTKKRITMMKKIKSNPWMRSKALYVIPVAALALSAFATPKFVAPVEDAVAKLEGKSTEISPNLQAPEEKRKVVEVKSVPRIVVDGKEMSPHEALKAVQGKEIKNSLASQPDGSTVLSINTTKSTDITEENLLQTLDLNAEDIVSVTVVNKENTIYIETDSIYNVVAENAQFPGGDGACFKFLAEHIRYPKLCQEFGVEGRVIVRFVIEKDGSISNISKMRGPGMKLSEMEVTAYQKDHPDSKEKLEAGQDLGDLLFEEGERVLKLMPKWKPAKEEKGNIVRSHYLLPIMFRLNKPQEGNGQK
ncbi:MAG: energy transducer TonB [Bacteroidaceae bacterium]|nr:energy transducer TonB [Bacteroidaceae bacterium]